MVTEGLWSDGLLSGSAVNLPVPARKRGRPASGMSDEEKAERHRLKDAERKRLARKKPTEG